MKKNLLLALSILATSVSYANQCPAPSDVVKQVGDHYEALAPLGWRWSPSWRWPRFNSSNVKLNWVMWDSVRINVEDENRVQCIYGNPEFDGKTGGVLQTAYLVEKKQVENHANWKQYGDTYFRCEFSSPTLCQFG